MVGVQLPEIGEVFIAQGSVYGGARLYSETLVAAFLRVPVGTLYQWRYRRIGPRAFKVGKHLRYDPGDVRDWLRSQAA